MGLSSMIATFGNVLWFYFLPLYYVEVFGASPLEITIIYAVWSAIVALGSAPAGALADRYGRKSVIVFSSLISAFAVFILAYSNNYLISAVALPISGLGSAFFRVSNTLVAESAGYSKRGTAFGTYQALSSIAAASSPLIGGLTITKTGFFPLFVVGGTLTLVAAIARLMFLRETLPKDQRVVATSVEKSVASFFEGFKSVLSRRSMLALVFIYSMYNLLVDQNSPIAPLYAKIALGIDNFGIGELFCAVLCVVAVSKYVFGRMTDRIGRKRTILISWLGEVSLVYIFVFAPADTISIALIGITLWMLFGVMDGPAINAWVAELAPTSNTRGYFMGVFYTSTILPTVPALVLSGYLFTIRPQLPFYANSILGIICIILLVGLKEPKTKTEDM